MQAPRGVVNVHPLSNYSFGHAPARFDKAGSAAERQARMQERYAAEGARRTVEGIILVTEHNHPHVLLLQARTHARVAVRAEAARTRRCAAPAARAERERAGGRRRVHSSGREAEAGRGRSGRAEAQAAEQARARRQLGGDQLGGTARVSRRALAASHACAAGWRVRGQLVAP